MKWKMRYCVQLLLATCCCLAFVPMTTAVTVTEVTEGAEATTSTTEETSTSEWETDGYQLEQYPEECYVEKSKVSELLVAMNKTVRFLNRADKYLECPDKMEVIKEDVATLEICSETRIAKIQAELDEITGEMYEMAAGLSHLSYEEYSNLDLRKFTLIANLNALQVMYLLPGPCETSYSVPYPTRSLVVYVEYSMNHALALYQSTRPKRQPTTTTPRTTTSSTTSRPTVEDMLDLEKSLAELSEMARLNPTVMSMALPKILNLRYNQRTTFESLVDFVDNLPSTEMKILGASALHDEMHRYSATADSKNLAELATLVKRLNESAPKSLPNAAKLKLADLVNDPDLIPFMLGITPQTTFAQLSEMAHSHETAMSIVFKDIVVERYKLGASFASLLKFIEDLPKVENRINGFESLYKEMRCCDRAWDAWQMKKLREKLIRIRDTTSVSATSTTPAVRSKLTDLILDMGVPSIIGEKAECAIINVAYGHKLTDSYSDNPRVALILATPYANSNRVYRNIGSRLTFHIGDFYASDSSSNKKFGNYQTKSSERYTLAGYGTGLEVDWKIVPVPGTDNEFRIMSASNDDFMFAHKSKTDGSSRLVLLGRKSFSNHDHIAYADRWTFHCKPGTYEISS